MNKKLLFMVLILFLSLNCAMARSDLRTMFQNNEAVIYGVNLRTFNADDKNGNGIIDFSLGETSGSFLNAIARLDELKDLGVNALHLLPITPTGKIKALGSAGSLYALSDFRTFNLQLADSESELSVKKQAKKFVEECHKRNIKVIIDLPSCGAYDLYLNSPDLFTVDLNLKPVIPADWADVRLFSVPDDNSVIHSDIFMLHKRFVDNILDIDADGIRADVATIKPFIFWKELINYTRKKKSDFLFLAEASEVWTKPASDKAYFTDWKKLLEAGFDGYYGDFFELKNWKTSEKLYNSVLNRQKILKKYKEKKSVIGSFATHDEVSPLIIGGENFAKIIIWLNATLPVNPYYMDGFLQSDDYIYDYANKKASETYTDDDYYYVHNGQIDIFNFSRKPDGGSDTLIKEHKIAMNLRLLYSDIIQNGKFIPLKSNNNKIFAYQRYLKDKSIVVILNRNLANSEEVKVKVKFLNKRSKVKFIKSNENIKFNKDTLNAALKAGEVIIITIDN